MVRITQIIRYANKIKRSEQSEQFIF